MAKNNRAEIELLSTANGGIADAKKALEIGDVAADGWHCIHVNRNGSGIQMSPPEVMPWGQAYRAGIWAGLFGPHPKELPYGKELLMGFNALTKNPKTLAAIEEGKIRPLWTARYSDYPNVIWGVSRVLPVPLLLATRNGELYSRDIDWAKPGEARFVRPVRAPG